MPTAQTAENWSTGKQPESPAPVLLGSGPATTARVHPGAGVSAAAAPDLVLRGPSPAAGLRAGVRQVSCSK